MKNIARILMPLGMILAFALTVNAKVEHLLPTPQRIEQKSGEGFALQRAVQTDALGQWRDNPVVIDFFQQAGLQHDGNATAAIVIEMVDSIDGAFNHRVDDFEDECYYLDIKPDTINVKATTRLGVIRAFQTLAQLAEGDDEVAAVEIWDWPAFKVRGFMHDVGRSYIDIDELKKEIDLLSRFKVNVFHWHFTENQAWRFQVKAFPQLTDSANMVRYPGEFYTQDQCRDLEEYAYERGVLVIPEIDMPGHSAAFERAMGHQMQTDEGVAELLTILDEVAETFPRSPYVHIGADETKITYPNFIETMTGKVHDLGKKVVVWNPASNLEITKDKGIDMTQMWSSRGKAISGMPNIDCRYYYSNHFDVFADIVGIFKSNIYYTPQGTDEVAGTIIGIWNDRKVPDQREIINQNSLYASALAIAERAWKGGGKQYIEQGGTTLPNSGDEYEEFADWERRFLHHKDNALSGEPIPYVKQADVRWRISEPYPNGGNAQADFNPEEGESAIATGAAIYLRHPWGKWVPGFYAEPEIDNTAYAWTYVYSPEDQDAGALVEFQNYSRTERDMAPENGNWDRKGSRIWLNDEELLPPTWENAGVSIGNNPQSYEIDLRNANFPARAPLPIRLHKGWNKVLIKLPYVEAPGVRLNKWMFTFVITDPEGKNALPGIIYSPDKQ